MFSGNLSVFFPAYNEEKNIERTVFRAVEVLKELNLKNWEVIVVDDGSKDKTAEVVEGIAKENKNIRVVSQENGGYGRALRTGFDNARYEWVVFTDSDGQFDFFEVEKFLEKTDEADYIIGYRIKREDPFYRKVTGKAWALSVFMLFGIWVKDIDCGFRMIKKEIYKKVSPFESTRGAMINAEMLIKVRRAGFKIVQVGVHHYPRMGGEATGVRFNVILRSYLELSKLWWRFKVAG